MCIIKARAASSLGCLEVVFKGVVSALDKLVHDAA